MKETARTISMKMSLHLADGVFAWLKEKGITSLDSIQQDILASRYHKVFFEPDEKMNPDEKCEFFGVLIDVAEDFLDEMGITVKDIPNDEREDDDSAIIYGSDYDNLADRFSEILCISRSEVRNVFEEMANAIISHAINEGCYIKGGTKRGLINHLLSTELNPVRPDMPQDEINLFLTALLTTAGNYFGKDFTCDRTLASKLASINGLKIGEYEPVNNSSNKEGDNLEKITDKIIMAVIENTDQFEWSLKQKKSAITAVKNLLEELLSKEKNPMLHEDVSGNHKKSEYQQLIRHALELSGSCDKDIMLGELSEWINDNFCVSGDTSIGFDLPTDLCNLFFATSDPQSFLSYFFELTNGSFWCYLSECIDKMEAEMFEPMDPVKSRKVLIHNDGNLENMAYLFITDAPECILADWCRNHAVEGQDIPQEALEEFIENGYEMKLLYPTDNVEVDAEDIAIIGYDEVYDINDKEYQPDREAENQKVIDSVKKAIVQYSDIDVVLNEEDGMLDVMYCSHNNSFPVEVTGAKLSHCDKEMLIHALDLMDVGHVGF